MMQIRKVVAAVVAAAVAAALATFPMPAFAEHLSGSGAWTVTYTAGGSLEDNYSASQFADDVSGLQPGDDITLSVSLRHSNAAGGDWYMANEVLKSLETGAAQGSAYEYLLTYDGPGGARTLYDSRSVGGDATGGLLDATNALDEFFYLDTLANGQTATVRLTVALDGETEGNAYFDTLAQLKMKFAVEPAATPGAPSTPGAKRVQTGDATDLLPYYAIMAVSGALLLALGAAAVRKRRAEDEEVAR